jgi:hypothetical protein
MKGRAGGSLRVTGHAAAAPVKSTATTMESTSVESATSEAVAEPAMPTESKTAEPATVVGIAVGRPIGIPVAVGVRRIRAVTPVLSLSSWLSIAWTGR